MIEIREQFLFYMLGNDMDDGLIEIEKKLVDVLGRRFDIYEPHIYEDPVINGFFISYAHPCEILCDYGPGGVAFEINVKRFEGDGRIYVLCDALIGSGLSYSEVMLDEISKYNDHTMEEILTLRRSKLNDTLGLIVKWWDSGDWGPEEVSTFFLGFFAMVAYYKKDKLISIVNKCKDRGTFDIFN